ncbi:MAG TPA: hypothetical protein VFQ24_01145 [Terriglobia bacterium]|nr:hypothetical protein [Terriglobia bacterium]
MALFSWQLSRRKFLAGGTLLSGLAGGMAGRLRAFARGSDSAMPRDPDEPSRAATNAATDAGMNVWAINDTVRVDPIRNRPFEENLSLFPDGVRSGYKQSNLVWDAAARRIKLKAARNETVAFQLVIERTGAKLTSVNVALADLAGPSGAKIPLDNFDMFREWYVHVQHPSKQTYTLGTGWYPDGLLPCLRWSGNLYPHTYVMPFDLPDPLNNVGKDQQSQAIWVDIYIPRSRDAAPPGKYSAPITISSDQASAQLTLDLQVWDFELPEESHLKPSIHTDTEINSFSEELELKYYQLARKHRIAISCLGYAPALKVRGTNVEIDWSKYDARLSKYFDGSAFTSQYGYSGPGYGVPTEYIVTPFDAYPWNLYKIPRGIQLSGKEWKFYAPWPVAPPREGPTPEYRAIWKNAFQAYQAHFDQHPNWNKTELVVFFNSLDESYDDLSRGRMFYFGQLLKESNVPRLRYRVDGSYPRETTKRLEDILHIANLGLDDCTPENAAEFKKRGIELWYYENDAAITDGDGLKCRALSWFAWKQHTDSWDIWEMDFNSLRAWQYAATYDNRNGAGMLVYRGETMGLDEPAASIRFKGMRRGSQDYEYFWLLAQTPGGREVADEAVRHVVHGTYQPSKVSFGAPGMWIHDPDEWDRARLKIGDAIEKAHASPT